MLELDRVANLPPNNDHILLSKLLGYVPALKPFITKFGLFIPWPYLQHMLRSRIILRTTVEAATRQEFEKRRLQEREKMYQDDDGRTNLLTSLVEAEDPETGARLDESDVASEAMFFLVAGSHSTAASLGFLFWHLLHGPKILARVEEEMEKELQEPLADGILSYAGMESRLSYFSAVMKENFRLTPAVQNPLPKVVPQPPHETVIAGLEIPPGSVVAANIWCLQRNPEIWGADAEEFRPERWLDGQKGLEKYLLHFGAGHRACVGQNMALISMWKSTVEILRKFEIVAAEAELGVGIGKQLKVEFAGLRRSRGRCLFELGRGTE